MEFLITKYCTKCHYCVEEHPDTFGIDSEGRAYVHTQNVLTEDEIEAIMGLCPVVAIVWGPVDQPVESSDLKSVKCEFESHQG